jgi:hypothetical protein
MIDALSLLAVCVLLRIVIFGLDRLDKRRPSDRSECRDLGRAFFYFSLFKRHRFFHRSKPA